MKIYDETKTEILENVDLEKGYLIQDKIVTKTIPAQEEVKEQFHYEYKEYPNGGKDQIKVIDVEHKPAKPETYEYEDIQVYKQYTEEEFKNNLRVKREIECFKIINRGQLWYDTLTDEQKTELGEWYNDWLNVTDTLEVPVKPKWL